MRETFCICTKRERGEEEKVGEGREEEKEGEGKLCFYKKKWRVSINMVSCVDYRKFCRGVQANTIFITLYNLLVKRMEYAFNFFDKTDRQINGFNDRGGL